MEYASLEPAGCIKNPNALSGLRKPRQEVDTPLDSILDQQEILAKAVMQFAGDAAAFHLLRRH